MTGAEQIIEGREMLGYTQAELGRRLSVTPQAISNWERGLNSPPKDRRLLMSQVLNLPIGAQVKEARIALGFTQEMLGKMVGLQTRTVRYYERGRDYPSWITLLNLATALGAKFTVGPFTELIAPETSYDRVDYRTKWVQSEDAIDDPVEMQLRRARHGSGLTLKQLGEKVGMNKSSIWRIENSRNGVTTRTIRRLAIALDIVFTAWPRWEK